MFIISVILHPFQFKNGTHNHEKSKSFVDDEQLPECFNVFSPVVHRENINKKWWSRECDHTNVHNLSQNYYLFLKNVPLITSVQIYLLETNIILLIEQ